jgi:hypothetical protein
MGGMTIGLMGNAEQAAITNVQFVSTSQVNATVQNTGAASVTIQSATIDGNNAIVAPTGTTTTTLVIAKGTTGYYTITLPSPTFTNSAQYTIKLQTAKGNTVVYTATYGGT